MIDINAFAGKNFTNGENQPCMCFRCAFATQPAQDLRTRPDGAIRCFKSAEDTRERLFGVGSVVPSVVAPS